MTSRLIEREQVIADMIWLGYTYAQIGQELGVSRQRVEQIVKTRLLDRLPTTRLTACQNPSCDTTFEQPRLGHKRLYCCLECRHEASYRRRGHIPAEQYKAERSAAADARREQLRKELYHYRFEMGLTGEEIAQRMGLHAPSVQVTLATEVPLPKPYQIWRREQGFDTHRRRAVR